MRLSEERISGLSSRIMNLLLDEEHLDLEIDEERFGVMIESKLTQLLRIEDEIDEEASVWMHLHKPALQDGTTEFEVELDKVKKNLADTKGYVLY